MTNSASQTDRDGSATLNVISAYRTMRITG
jgi:hypothetical protein